MPDSENGNPNDYKPGAPSRCPETNDIKSYNHGGQKPAPRSQHLIWVLGRRYVEIDVQKRDY